MWRGVGNSYAQAFVGRLEPVWTGRTHSLVEKKNINTSGKHVRQEVKKNTLGTTSWEGVTVCKGPLPPKWPKTEIIPWKKEST